MPCLFALIGAFFPRIALVAVWLSGYGGAAFQSVLIPLLGFFVMPFTTLFYAIGMNEFGMQGMGVALLIVGVILDVGGWGGTRSGYRHGRTRYWVRR